MNLVIDIGNSLAKCLVIKQDNIVCCNATASLSPEFLEEIITRFPQIDKAILCSVKSESDTEKINSYLQTQFPSKFINFTHRTPVPLRNLYGTPETLGYDRMAAAVGAWHFFPKRDLMVIDCGTAITIDFVSKVGEYLGGNISPGINTRFKALNVFTGKLPVGHISDNNVPAIGRNTQEAIEAGVLNGVIAEIESYIEHNLQHKIIFTGGDVIFFAKRLKNPIFVVCNLVPLGLNQILKYNITDEQ